MNTGPVTSSHRCGKALGVLLLLAQTGLHVPDEARDRITDCDDMDI